MEQFNLTKLKLAIIGLGYVGLPLAVAFGKKIETVGFDISADRISDLKNGFDSTGETNQNELFESPKLLFSNNLSDIRNCNVYIVTVPTPINRFKSPDLTPLLKASEMIGSILKKDDVVIYESTVYPGCTEEDCVPVLERFSSLKYNLDFFCGYSPERINPGDRVNTLTKIKKVTSGSNDVIAKFVNELYLTIIEAGTHLASSIKVAEASKAIENAQRDVNISFVNELALIFDKLNIDTSDVLEAASTKWNFLKYKPGLVGGHCIGVDPYYLAHKADSIGYTPQVILSGRRVNDHMSTFIASKVVKLMIQKGNIINSSRVLLLGITFKENCPDIRNSKVVDIYNELLQYGITVDVVDPLANPLDVKTEYRIELTSSLQKYDGIILAVAHNEFLNYNFDDLKKSDSSIIYDIKSVLDRSIIDGRL